MAGPPNPTPSPGPQPPGPSPSPTPDPPPAPNPPAPPPANDNAHPSFVLSVLLIAAFALAAWTTVVTIGHFVDTCLTGSPTGDVAASASATPSSSPAGGTTNTNVCMSGDIELSPTNLKISGAPSVLLLVALPWAFVFAVLWLVYKGKVRILADGSVETHPLTTLRAPGLVVAGIGLALAIVLALLSK